MTPDISLAVYDCLSHCNIREYPVKIRALVHSRYFYDLNIGFQTYENAEKYKTGISDYFRSKDGICVYFFAANQHIIFYNTKIKPQSRITFTIAHEIGHALLGHMITTAFLSHKHDRNELYIDSSTLDTSYEKEADSFAWYLLAHPLVLSGKNCTDRSSIAKLCNISNAAASRCAAQKDDAGSFNRWDHMIKRMIC